MRTMLVSTVSVFVLPVAGAGAFAAPATTTVVVAMMPHILHP